MPLAPHTTVVGRLIYVIDNTRSNISHDVRSMHTANPYLHCDDMKWTLLILLGTIDISLYCRGCSLGSVAVAKYFDTSQIGG